MRGGGAGLVDIWYHEHNSSSLEENKRQVRIFVTLLNLSATSVPPPFLLFLGVIARDITGSGTNIEVIANFVLSMKKENYGLCHQVVHHTLPENKN